MSHDNGDWVRAAEQSHNSDQANDEPGLAPEGRRDNRLEQWDTHDPSTATLSRFEQPFAVPFNPAANALRGKHRQHDGQGFP